MNLRYCNDISKNTCDIIKEKEICLADNGILHALFTSFTQGKSGQVLIKYSLGAAYDMTYLHYNSHKLIFFFNKWQFTVILI